MSIHISGHSYPFFSSVDTTIRNSVSGPLLITFVSIDVKAECLSEPSECKNVSGNYSSHGISEPSYFIFLFYVSIIRPSGTVRLQLIFNTLSAS